MQKRSQTHAKAPTVHVNYSVPWMILETQITQHTPPPFLPPPPPRPNVCSMKVLYINSRNNYSPLSRCTNELTEEGGGVCGAAEERRRTDLKQNNTRCTGYLERRVSGGGGGGQRGRGGWNVLYGSCWRRALSQCHFTTLALIYDVWQVVNINCHVFY